jgi:ADP-ribose pyrophosphatase YjhB (NUDIX family)
MKVSAQVVLINQQGLVLGVSRKNDHYDFGFIGGKMEPEDNGDAMVTAIRETLEETGLNISNLRLILAIHKDGYMSYTYLADYEGEINHNEPHVVKWLPMERLVNGSFGKYNKLVSESLKDMGVDFQYKMSIVEIENDLKAFINKTLYNGVQMVYDGIRRNKDFLGNEQLTVYLKYTDGTYIDEELDNDDNFENGLFEIGKRYGFIAKIPTEYFSK